MIKSLRRKFIAVTMLSVVLVLAIIVAGINLANYRSVVSDADNRLAMLADELTEPTPDNMDAPDAAPVQPVEDGTAPQDRKDLPDADMGGQDLSAADDAAQSGEDAETDTRDLLRGVRSDALYFAVSDNDGTCTVSDRTPLSPDTDTAAALIEEAENACGENSSANGYADNYRYYIVRQDDGSMLAVFLDCTQQISTMRSFLLTSAGISLLGLVLVFLLVLFFSGRVVKPVAESYAKQKRFITDASHELKTPLAILSANADVLEMEQGESEWTASIRHQVSRLSDLTEKLVMLSRMEEEGTDASFSDFNVSAAAEEQAENFLPVAAAKNIDFTYQIQPDLTLHGSEPAIRQLLSLLLDNAMKYSGDAGKVRLTLTGGKNTTLTVWNTAEGLAPGDQNELFERFYRPDGSRSSQTGGSGIGLSVVRAIVNAHKGKVTARSEDGKSIVFTAVLP